jgi:hypothetical protein
MSSEEAQFDSMYLQILQMGKGIDPLFTSLFSCLRRKTDFFQNPDQAFSIIEKSFKVAKLKFEQDQQKEKLKKEKELEKIKEKEKEKEKDKTSGVKEITKEEFERRKAEENKQKEIKNDVKVEEKVNTDEKKEEEDDETKKIKEKIAKMDESERKELLKRTAHLEDKNGGRTRHYTWTQPQIENFDMYVALDDDVKANQIKVDYDSRHLTVKVKGEVLFGGELFAPINADSFMWTFDEIKGKKVINITFEKIHKMQWWDHVIKGDELLSLTKINPEPTKLSDIDPSMRPEIEKMMLENSMKMQGKPFHKDPKTNDMLQQFMKQHPEMDFSKAKIN